VPVARRTNEMTISVGTTGRSSSPSTRSRRITFTNRWTSYSRPVNEKYQNHSSCDFDVVRIRNCSNDWCADSICYRFAYSRFTRFSAASSSSGSDTFVFHR